MVVPEASVSSPGDPPGGVAASSLGLGSPPKTRPGLPAGPRLPVAALVLLWWFWPAWFYDRFQRRYGSTYRLRLPGGLSVISTSDPSVVREVLTLNAGDYRVPGAAALMLEPYLGAHSLLLMDGEQHLRERRLLAQAFHGERMQTYRQIIADATRRDMDRWSRGKPFALRPHMQAITFEVILRAVFGIESVEASAALRASMERFVAYSGSLILLPPLRRNLGPHSPWGRFTRLRSHVYSRLDELIRSRRGDPRLGARTDILSLLLQARDQDGAHLSDVQLRDELMTMLLAGHETTATALAWAFDLLLHHPAALARLIEELRGSQELYLDAVIKEALRLRPVIPEAGRALTRPMIIDGWTLPEGTTVATNVFLVHRSPAVYADPLTFRPERFLADDAEQHAWVPFGGGVRRCLGAAFAMEELRVVLRTVLTGTSLRAATRSEEKARRRAVTLIPRHGTRVIVDAPFR